jgi:N-acetylneuraminic acid mutarotase
MKVDTLMLIAVLSLMAMLTSGIAIIPSSSYFNTTSMDAAVKTSFWTKGANMPTPRSEVAGAALGEKIYIIGGFRNIGNKLVNTNIVEVYDTEKNTWSTAPQLPVALNHVGAASYNNKLYVVGGYLDKEIPSNKLFIFDPATNKWQEGKPMPTARAALTANFINGTLYAVGGVSSSGTLKTNEAYNPQTNTWTEKKPMPTVRHHLASAVVDGKLYAIGGRITSILSFFVNLNANEVYNPSQDTWNILEPMPSKRSGLAASVVNGSIYLFGGEHPFGTFNKNEKYDPKINKWTSEAPMPTARHGLAAVAINDKIYVIAGGPKPGILIDILPSLTVSNINEIFHIMQ